MTQTLPPLSPALGAAHSQAASNYAANRAALTALQSDILPLLDGPTADVEWLFARDGSLTAMVSRNQWWSNCSLPRRAAQFMFKTLEIRGVLACFLFPVHAAQIRIALNRLESQQAVLALVPDLRTLQIILHCEDFSDDFRDHRLWFAAGENWETALAELFVKNPGLPTPADFIRAISADQTAADALIAPAQKIFADETTRRAAEIQSIAAHSRTTTSSSTVCVIAPMRFRLWNDAPATLASVLSASEDFTPQFFDSDDPASSSPLALGRCVARTDAVITANLARADLPPVIASDTPIITWITLPRIPTLDASAPRDGLILADPSWSDRARAQGWPESRIHIGTWPITPSNSDAGAGDQPASLIADTVPLVPPKSINEFSSHLLLWDQIVAEIRRDPSVLKAGIDAYLTPRIAKFQIDQKSFNKSIFIEHLILPAYQQSVARAILAKRIPVRLFGRGWAEVEEFAAHAAGPVQSREHFNHILAHSSALVHAWPIAHIHPIETTSLPIVRPAHLTAHNVSEIPTLSQEIIRTLLA